MSINSRRPCLGGGGIEGESKDTLSIYYDGSLLQILGRLTVILTTRYLGLESAILKTKVKASMCDNQTQKGSFFQLEAVVNGINFFLSGDEISNFISG